METRRLLVWVLMGFAMMCGGGAQLTENFYSSTCPNVEAIVNQAVTNKLAQTFTTIPATLRLFFHDCMVEGCDASVMIASPNGDAEKDAPINLSLAGDGFDTVIKAKEAVEAECPGVVSCADILALAARDVVVLVGGPSFNVELGRRDGLVSIASRVEGNLPKANFNLNQLNAIFSRHGMSQTDMIALSGAHTVGFSHCNEFTDRLYSSQVDPTMNSDFAQRLMQLCPRNFDPQVAIDLDVQSPRAFDNLYYQNLVSGQGLLTSDQVLFTDSDSQSTVVEFANNPAEFNAAFGTAMRKLGRVGVKTGKEGEIRIDCTKFNSS
ncbi:peroxidase 55 [Prosopis cineraria]|uniref:peroxidase 55 n=1 Tax=Prosopis cineraria TaxID=364024 RepID=UPI002410AAD8|nr:peroxidase 55 [Prosopis cineraria]